jgi:hypothetical protein
MVWYMSDTDDESRGGWLYECRGTKVSVYMETDVQRAAQDKAKSLKRSVSWLVNRAMRRELGMMDNETAN